MAKVKLNPVIQKIHGKVGDLVFKRYNDDVIMSRNPDLSGITATQAQIEHREEFRLATVYANSVLADPVQKAVYDAVAKKKKVPAFAIAVADFMNEPAVEQIDVSAYTGQPAQTIRVTASDDFEVAAVSVKIMAADESVIEQGAAVKGGNDSSWTYTTTAAASAGQTLTVEATATDRPGNVAKKSETKAS